MTTVRIDCYEGRFNLLDPSQKSWQLRLLTPYGSVSQIFDEEPYHDGSVADVLGVIEAQLKSLWYSSSRDETLKRITTIREHITECEILLIERTIADDERILSEVSSRIERNRKTLAALHEELLEEATNER